MPSRPLTLAASMLVVTGSLALGLAPAVAAGPAPSRPQVGPEAGGLPGAQVAVGDADRRGPSLSPTATARAAVDALHGVDVSWNQYGTPLTLTRGGAAVATGLAGSDAESVARSFLARNAGLFGLSTSALSALTVVSDTALTSSEARVVLLRQSLGGLALAEDGQVAVLLTGTSVFSVTSSLVPTSVLGAAPATTPSLTAAAAVRAAARDAGVLDAATIDLATVGTDALGFTGVRSSKLAQAAKTRLRILPTTDRGARLVWQTLVQNVAGPEALAVTSYVDAARGDVLLRLDGVDTLAEGMGTAAAAAPAGGPVTGTYSSPACSTAIPMAIDPGTRTIGGLAASTNGDYDLSIFVYRNGRQIGYGDLLSSPETVLADVTPAAVASDVFTTEICPFEPNNDKVNFAYAWASSTLQGATLQLPDLTVADQGSLDPASFRMFRNSPALQDASDANRATVCVSGPVTAALVPMKNLTDCDHFTFLDGSPNGHDTIGGIPTGITSGNNALTTNAQASTSLTPGAPATPGLSTPVRTFNPAFSDSWASSKCDPTSIANPAQNNADIQAAVVNLFSGHNQVHDFAYELGLTEPRGALQVDNFGKPGAGGDPEIGNAQNAAATNTLIAPSGALTGRNNANQITLMDGTPGITNQYLFEPVVGFYGGCADGDLDASIFLHEYSHAISNRLIGGPDTTLSGQQAGSMGESWSDLIAVEYLQEFGLAGDIGSDPYSVGAYATANNETGIRGFNLHPSKNPLTYGQFGFDATGPEVHADGEIWNAIQMRAREALMQAYDSTAPSGDLVLQEACALGRTAAGEVHSTFADCPGNRRWVTYLFDGMIAQANGSPSMVDIKNTMLSSAGARGQAADVVTLGDAFAERGLGASSDSSGTSDTDPKPGYDSPTASHNAAVTFAVVDSVTGAPVPNAKVFIGTFEARSTPAATSAAPTAPIIGGMEHKLLVQAPGYGMQRFLATFDQGSTTTKTLSVQKNLASSTNGAKVEAGPGTVQNLDKIIDDTEGTDGAFTGAAVADRFLTVDLGASTTVSALAVSALHHPAGNGADSTTVQSRLQGLRNFTVQASSDDGATYSDVYVSADEFGADGMFPGVRPRATAANLQLRTINLATPVTADHLRLVVASNQCTGSATFDAPDDTLESDPLVNPQCGSVAANAQQVGIAELQAFAAPMTLTDSVVDGPTPVVPEAPVAVLLPLIAAALVGVAAVRRRRSTLV